MSVTMKGWQAVLLSAFLVPLCLTVWTCIVMLTWNYGVCSVFDVAQLTFAKSFILGWVLIILGSVFR